MSRAPQEASTKQIRVYEAWRLCNLECPVKGKQCHITDANLPEAITGPGFRDCESSTSVVQRSSLPLTRPCWPTETWHEPRMHFNNWFIMRIKKGNNKCETVCFISSNLPGIVFQYGISVKYRKEIFYFFFPCCNLWILVSILSRQEIPARRSHVSSAQ